MKSYEEENGSAVDGPRIHEAIVTQNPKHLRYSNAVATVDIDRRGESEEEREEQREEGMLEVRPSRAQSAFGWDPSSHCLLRALPL